MAIHSFFFTYNINNSIDIITIGLTIHLNLIDIFAIVDWFAIVGGVAHYININIDANYRGKAKELQQS